jgi:hypothetical protein
MPAFEPPFLEAKAPEAADILQGRLPEIHDGTSDRPFIRRRNLKHHRAHVLRVDEGREVDGVGVRGQGLYPPVGKVRPVDYLVETSLGPAHARLEHEVVIDRRHSPNDGLDGPALDGASSKLLVREELWRLRHGRRRASTGDESKQGQQRPAKSDGRTTAFPLSPLPLHFMFQSRACHRLLGGVVGGVRSMAHRIRIGREARTVRAHVPAARS